MLDKEFWADVAVAGEHLRLFSEHSAQGIKRWIVPSQAVNDIEQGKKKAAEYARFYLQYFAHSERDSELPPLNWKKARSL